IGPAIDDGVRAPFALHIAEKHRRILDGMLRWRPGPFPHDLLPIELPERELPERPGRAAFRLEHRGDEKNLLAWHIGQVLAAVSMPAEISGDERKGRTLLARFPIQDEVSLTRPAHCAGKRHDLGLPVAIQVFDPGDTLDNEPLRRALPEGF